PARAARGRARACARSGRRAGFGRARVGGPRSARRNGNRQRADHDEPRRRAQREPREGGRARRLASAVRGERVLMASERRATIVITRPGGQSSALLARLDREGFDALEFPLIDIAPVADDTPLRAALDELYGPERYALVVFVSP